MWLYGSAAFAPELSFRDVDLLIVASGRNLPAHFRAPFRGRHTLSCDVFPPSALDSPNLRTNGGLYFSLKFLAPHALLFGQDHASTAARALRSALYPWAFWLGAGSAAPALSATQLLARLFLLKININPHYLGFIARWWPCDQFSGHWSRLEQLTCQALEQSTARKHVTPGRRKRTWRPIGTAIPPEERRLLLLERLAAHFWLFGSTLRRGDTGFVDLLFGKCIRNSRAPNASASSRIVLTRLFALAGCDLAGRPRLAGR